MYLVPVLIGVLEDDPDRARRNVQGLLHDSALLVGEARYLPDHLIATAELDVRVHANQIELAPARTRHPF